MEQSNQITKKDMALVNDIFKFTSPKDIPLKFEYGSRVIHGIPDEFSPKVSHRLLTANTVLYTIDGTDENGLNIRAEYVEYRDFPVTEWVFYFTNKGQKDVEIVKNIRIEGYIPCKNAIFEHGNGDTQNPSGFSFFNDKVEDKTLTVVPYAGTSCHGAFPYMKLHGEDREIRAAIGWTGRWIVDVMPAEDGVIFSCGQERCQIVLHPGEMIRTPRLNLMAYTNEDAPYRGINIWRHWYLKHILPRENGQPVPPKKCMHYFEAEGHPEFTGASEENQLNAMAEYLRRGIKPDIWWVDAGWYPCNYVWYHIDNWYPDPKRFPNGLAPIGKACKENDIQFLLWFEPERVWVESEFFREKRKWLLTRTKPDGSLYEDALFDLGNKEAREWMINHVDSIIKESGVSIYRQDFNFDPHAIWWEHEAEDRIGMIENQHIQGYLAYWDELILRNPGLWIDSCAGGGRRNDLETMRRAVTLHYTDVGYGNHPVKQKQYREMFEWIPYFRSHNMSWDKEDGTYGGVQTYGDEFAYHCAFTPSITSMLKYNDSDELYEISKKMDPIWYEAAELELSGDYYPITECNGDAHDWYAMQFDDAVLQKGFVQVIRNVLVDGDTFEVKMPCIHRGKTYTFTDRESKNTFTLTADELENGWNVTLPKRSGVVYFYCFE